MLGVGDLAGQAAAARRITLRAGITLHKDTMENGVAGKVDPVLIGKVSPADAEVHAAHRDMMQPVGCRNHLVRGLIANNAN